LDKISISDEDEEESSMSNLFQFNKCIKETGTDGSELDWNY